ncbi:hypothetical protein CTAYLR_000753 [Chrysophaeum taylorii]|uniref:Vacuolar protein sorting-associated protein 45 n=1 Tax=Chrysophaeum taylorii TaxID=2483200 RepID=A0AAD7UPG7_9STRA|nr:hypothetical protein CTAYLR_000753 [Chrysophaeum taylorii]
MNVINATRYYVDKIVSDQNASGMKVLLLDDSTTKTVATVYSQTQILERDVFLVERVEQAARHEPMKHLKASVFVRPTWANLELLKAELHQPRFSEYHIFFSNVVPSEMLQQLADADEEEVVRQVQEYYADYVAVNEDLFTINQRCSLRLSTDHRDAARAEMLARNVSGVLSVLLSLKTQPAAIRYQAASRVARQVAVEVHEKIEADGIFHFKNRSSGPLLLILDRADDPVTPLLSQWTYQAMVHELLGLNNNRCKLPDQKNPEKMDEVVLSCTQDEFFAGHRYANFGDLGGAVKKLLDDYQAQTQMNERISSIEDMQSFVQRYPAFRSQSLNVSKHVSLISELSRLVDVCALMDVSQLEQDMACNDDRSAQWREMMEKLMAREIKVPDKLRLALLYCLRYEGSANVERIKVSLEDARVAPEKILLVDAILRYGGRAVRGPGLFGSERSLMAKMTQSLKTSLEGVENVYAQHVPLLMETLDMVNKSKLKDQHYPAVTCVSAAKPREVIVFVVGGVTYEEACKVAELNAANSGLKVVLGGSYIHNSTSFLDDLSDAFATL